LKISVEVPGRCRRGHDLTNPDNVTVDVARWRCLACMREDARVRRRNAKPSMQTESCKRCGGNKWRDRRTMCLKCAAEVMKERRMSTGEVPVEVILSKAVADECLMPWERPKRSADSADRPAPGSPVDVANRQARPDDGRAQADR
jgi:hypothetical protein